MAKITQREGRDVKGMDCYETTSSATHYGKGSIRRGWGEEEEKYKRNYDLIDWSKKLIPSEKLDNK
jgi:hypothetical protein